MFVQRFTLLLQLLLVGFLQRPHFGVFRLQFRAHGGASVLRGLLRGDLQIARELRPQLFLRPRGVRA